MKITIIGTTAYRNLMLAHQRDLEDEGHEIRIPTFDDQNLDELEIGKRNREAIEWADEIHMLWDQRSIGTIFDFGMVFALRKPFKIIYIQPKTFKNLMEKYERTKP